MTPIFHLRTASASARLLRFFLFTTLLLNADAASAQPQSPDELKNMSLEELMDIQVTSVSRRPENLTEVASAIQVITRDDIRRSAATNLPEALRLASNLQVAQLNSSAWIIGARGFNAVFSNKLLVMIDGRTVYSPLFAGVFWDVQNVLLEDVERIEVISGPGGTIWGANAVNGVINIITRNASESQGLYAKAGAGTFLRRQAELRYGGKIGSKAAYRVYGLHTNRDHTFTNAGADHSDAWYLTQGGISLDWNPTPDDAVVVHGNVYNGTHKNVPAESTVDGQNILGRWTHAFTEKSDLTLQAYYDRTWRRDIPSTISDQTQTLDLEVDHRFQAGERHTLVWGGGYRRIENDTQNSTDFVGFIPARREMGLFTAYIQDEISLVKDRLNLILGTKLQHNVFTDFEVQPTARLAWIRSKATFWGAISRAVRTPSRIDADYHLPVYPVPPNLPSVAGGPNFKSEEVVAYELGYRVSPTPRSFVSLAAFHNRYDDLYSVEPLEGTLTYQIQNGTEGASRGVEIAGRVEVGRNWKLRAGYSYFYKDLDNKPGHVYDYADLGNDATHRVMVHSILDLPANLQLDISFRYIDSLPKPYIPDYLTFDARLAWVLRKLEISFIGQNLWEDRHREFIYQIPRAFYGNIAWRL